MSDEVIYIGKDLEAMAFAENYHRWILDEFRPYLGRRIVEVGAGSGEFSKLVIECAPDELTLVEPSTMFDQLAGNLGSVANGRTSLHFHNATFRSVAGSIAERQPDTIVYVNVLEHIEDDEAELSAVHSTLASGGHCLIFVPAFMSLYGEFDRRVGHFRRYARGEVESKCAEAGLRVVKSSFFDVLGVLPWWVKYRLLRSDSLSSSAVSVYDRLVVPFSSRIERHLKVPFGKNILVVASRS